MNRKKITWRFAEPEDFPCHICRENRATVMAKIKIRSIVAEPLLCESCGAKSDSEITELFETGG